MSKAFEGFYSIYQNGSWGGGTPYSPQAIPVEGESLSVQQDIRFRENLVGEGRVSQRGALVPLAQTPKGAIAYAFRSDDCLKVFFSHFQCGSILGTTGGTYHYSFYPSKSNPNFISGSFSNGPYGGTAYPYSVSILKRLTGSGTNSLFFKNGICDKLDIQWAANEEVKLNADYVFRSVDTGTQITQLPDSTVVGSYSREPNFHSIFGTVAYNGASFEVESVQLNFRNNIQPLSRVGARNPESFHFGRYTVSGELGFDFPSDGVKYIGSMIGTGTFSLSLTMRNSATSIVQFTLPSCVLAPFEVNAQDNAYQLRLPFRAFESGTLPPVSVDVYSSYNLFGAIFLWDALLGARTLSEFTLKDAENGARTLSNYSIYDRDI